MKTKIKNILVGAFVLVAIFALIGVIMFIKPTIGDGKQVLNVRFSDINNLHVGTRVLFAGRPVGEVVTLSEIHDAREEPTDELGRVYFYQLTLKIDSSVRVYNTDEISIQTSGLMGEKSIAITPKAPPKGVTPRLITAQPVYANSVDTFQNAVLEFSELATSMEETFHQISKWVKNHGEELATTVRAAGSA
jgi:phospholipid/cholesterol/gamma-HCH transport system substrate-binding protein